MLPANQNNQPIAVAPVRGSVLTVVIGQRTLVGADTGTPTHKDGPSSDFQQFVFVPEAVAGDPQGPQQIVGELARAERHQLSVGAEPSVPYGGSRPSLGLIHFALVVGLVLAGIWAATKSGWKSKR